MEQVGHREGKQLKALLNHVRNLCAWNTGDSDARTSGNRARGRGAGCADYVSRECLTRRLGCELCGAGLQYPPQAGHSAQRPAPPGAGGGGRLCAGRPASQRGLWRALSRQPSSSAPVGLTPNHRLSCEEAQTRLNYSLLVGPRGGLECLF